MELMQLRMALAAAEARSLQKAAQKVGRTPQAVRMALDKLEAELGLGLFDPTVTRGLQLTAAGEVFVDYAARSLSLLDECVSTIQEIRSANNGRLRIGSNESSGEYLLPQLTDSFRRKYPAVKVLVTIGYSDSTLASLARNELDIALVADPPKDHRLRGMLLMVDRLVAIVNSRHPLAGREEITIEDLACERLVLLGKASELHERVAGKFRQFQAPVNASVETSTLESIKRMVARDVGVGIVPRLCVSQEPVQPDLAVKTIAQFGEDRELWMVYPQRLLPAAEAFISIVKAAYPKCAGHHSDGCSCCSIHSADGYDAGAARARSA